MKIKMIVLFFLLFIIIVFGGIFLFSIKEEITPSLAKYISICFADKCFNVEVASSFSSRMKGLMNRKFLASDAGMLFVFPDEDKHAFWMKNTLIPLDIIWINGEREVVHIAKNVQPCNSFICPSISPDKPGKYVLEINGGKIDEIGLITGDKTQFDLQQ